MRTSRMLPAILLPGPGRLPRGTDFRDTQGTAAPATLNMSRIGACPLDGLTGRFPRLAMEY